MHKRTQQTFNLETTTRERILQTAEALSRRFGLGKMTVADIARELSMSPANVYKHFGSKNEILETIGLRKSAKIQEQIDLIVVDDKPALDRIEQIILFVDKFFDRHTLAGEQVTSADFIKDLVAIEVARFNSRWQFIEDFHLSARNAFTRILQQGVESGELVVDDPQEAGAAIFDCFANVFEPLLVARYERPVRVAGYRRQIRLLTRALR